jgi:hypothetical protein
VVGAYSAHGALEGRVANVGLSSRHGVLMYIANYILGRASSPAASDQERTCIQGST